MKNSTRRRQGSQSALIERLESRELLSASPKLTVHAVMTTPVEGATAAQINLATFTDSVANSSDTFTATINWGDGSAAAAGTVTPNASGGYAVSGIHGYTSSGKYKVTIALAGSDGSSATFKETVKVLDAPITATGIALTTTKGEAFTGVVATFVDADPAATAGPPATETAKIAWGDGTTSAGTISQPVAGGPFDVTGTHTYQATKTGTLAVTVTDKGGSKSVGTAAFTVNPPAPTTTPSLVGDFKGKIKIGGIGSLAGSQSFELDITAQTIDSITGTLFLDGGNVASGTLVVNSTTHTLGELSNGNFSFTLTGSNYQIVIAGHISPDGLNITNGFADVTGKGIGNFHGDFSLTFQGPPT